MSSIEEYRLNLEVFKIKMQVYQAQMQVAQAQIQLFTAHGGLHASAEGCDIDIDPGKYTLVVNEMLLHGCWAALYTYGGVEISLREQCPMHLEASGTLSFGTTTVHANVACTVLGITLGAFQHGGERMSIEFGGGPMEVTIGQLMIIQGKYITIGE